jgi:hypothetical protein
LYTLPNISRIIKEIRVTWLGEYLVWRTEMSQEFLWGNLRLTQQSKLFLKLITKPLSSIYI